MKARIHLLAVKLFALTLPALAVTVPELRLANGTVYKNARIVAINGDTVAIVCEKGAAEVPADAFDLVTLAQAKNELDARAAEQKKQADKIAAADADARAQREQDAKAQATAITEARAMKASSPQPKVSGVGKSLSPQQFIAFKSAFPPKETRRVPVVVHSSKRSKDRVDNLEVDVPPIDLWNELHGSISTATLESLPISLAKVDEKIATARRQLTGKTSGYPYGMSGQSADAQARYTLDWIDGTLIPYLARARMK